MCNLKKMQDSKTCNKKIKNFQKSKENFRTVLNKKYV
jgi:hypothetical protein